MSEYDRLLVDRNGRPLIDEEKAIRSRPPAEERATAGGGLQRKGQVSAGGQDTLPLCGAAVQALTVRRLCVQAPTWTQLGLVVAMVAVLILLLFILRQ